MALSQEKFIRLWQKRIAKGRTYYIVKFALLWGGAMIVFVPLFNTIFHDNFTLDTFFEQFILDDFYLKAIAFPLAGAFLGYINWNNGIKRYKQITEVENTEND